MSHIFFVGDDVGAKVLLVSVSFVGDIVGEKVELVSVIFDGDGVGVSVLLRKPSIIPSPTQSIKDDPGEIPLLTQSAKT